jgi:hypothetical protein
VNPGIPEEVTAACKDVAAVGDAWGHGYDLMGNSVAVCQLTAVLNGNASLTG